MQEKDFFLIIEKNAKKIQKCEEEEKVCILIPNYVKNVRVCKTGKFTKIIQKINTKIYKRI